MTTKKTRRRAERRERPRADARLSMRVESADEGAHAQIVTESQNISASGIYCLASHYLAPLSKVGLTIVLPHLPGRHSGQELVKCDGIVVRCEPLSRRGERHFELACMFSGLDGKRRDLIEEFVTWRNLQALREATRVPRRRPAAAAASSARRPAASTNSRKATGRRAAAARPSRSTAKRARKTTSRRSTAR
jgi:hypothetical protein